MAQNDNVQMTFEYIDSKAKLALPLLYKILIENSSNANIEKYSNYIYGKYAKENDNIKKLLSQIKLLKNIPIELLFKYYIRT